MSQDPVSSRRGFLRGAATAAGATAALGLLPPSIRRALAIPAAQDTGTISDVKHVVILMQENRAFEGQVVELMVAEGEVRKDAATHRLSGRARDNRLVHFTPVDAAGETLAVRPGDMVEVVVSYAAPHHLIADAPTAVRRTRSGDAWEARTKEPVPAGVGLGMPTVGVPAPLPEANACR